jgi:phytoene dehydrogenase-like protein
MTARNHPDGNAWDAAIVGGGIGGLATAAYLARQKKRVILFEANESFGGRSQNTFLANGVLAPVAAERYSAVDNRTIEDLRLHDRGLHFVQRMLPLAVLRPSGRHLVLPHDFFGARGAIRAESAADGRAYAGFRRNLFRAARRLRPHWAPDRISASREGGASHDETAEMEAALADLDIAANSSANAYLERWFESETVKVALAADAMLDGLSPDEVPSALVLFWRAAQESSGLQGAIGQIRGGPAASSTALAEAARDEGAILLPGARVARIELKGRRAAGVTLETGTTIEAACVVSNLSRRGTLEGLVAPDAVPFGEMRSVTAPVRIASATIAFALNGIPPFVGLSRTQLQGRIIIADRPEAAGEAKRSALRGAVPGEVVMELRIPSLADETLAKNGQHVLTAHIPYLPQHPENGWDTHEEALKKRVIGQLEYYAPGIRDRIIDSVVITPADFAAAYGTRFGVTNPRKRFLRPYEERIRTPIAGLFLCGADADPLEVTTGRAGRLAASLAVSELDDARGSGDD